MRVLKNTCATVVMAAAMGFSQAASAVPILNFMIDGDTAFEPFSLNNLSTEGERLMRFHLDISPTGTCFDVTDTNKDSCPGSAANGLVDFAPRNNTGDLTGLWPSDIRDGDTDLTFTFGHFLPGESFVWDLDVDRIGAGTFGTILGNELIGATAWALFSNGDRLSGTVGAVQNNPDAGALLLSNEIRIVPVEGPEPGPDVVPNPVPLPSTLSLFALAMVGLRMRKRKSA